MKKTIYYIPLLFSCLLSASTFTDFLDSADAEVYINNENDINETRTDFNDTTLSDNEDYIRSISLTTSSSMTDSDLSGIENMSRLTDLTINNNALTNPDLSSTNIVNLNLNSNTLTGFTLPSSIEKLYVEHNNLETLSVAGLSNLKEIYSYDNNIHSFSFLQDIPDIDKIEIGDPYQFNFNDNLGYNYLEYLNNPSHVKFYPLGFNPYSYDSDGVITDLRANIDSPFCHLMSQNIESGTFSLYGIYSSQSYYPFDAVCKANRVLSELTKYGDNKNRINYWVDLNDDGIKTSDETEASGHHDYYWWETNKSKIKELHIHYWSDRNYSIRNMNYTKYQKYESSYSGLEELTNLEELTITARNLTSDFRYSDSMPMPDLSPLTKLKKLTFIGTKKVDWIAPIADQLEFLFLNFGRNKTEYLDTDSINAIKQATNLKAFGINSGSPLVFDSLGKWSDFAPNITVAYLPSMNNFTNLDFLNGLNLEVLSIPALKGYKINDLNISELLNQTNLKFLRLDGVSNISDMTPLKNLDKLGQSVDLSSYSNLKFFETDTNSGRYYYKHYALGSDLTLSDISTTKVFTNTNGNIAFEDKELRDSYKPLYGTPFCSNLNNDTALCRSGNDFLDLLFFIKEDYYSSSDSRQWINIWFDLNDNDIIDSSEYLHNYDRTFLEDNKDKIKSIEMGRDFTDYIYDNDSFSKFYDALIGLNELTNLKKLVLITDKELKPEHVSNLVNLETLDYYNTSGISDISFLSGLTNLKHLILSNPYNANRSNQSENYFNFYRLRYSDKYSLVGSKNLLTDFSPLNNLTRLELLAMGGFRNLGTDISDIDFKNFPNLKELTINSGTAYYKPEAINIQTVIDQLSGNDNLITLVINNTYFTGEADFSNISNNLELLNLEGNSITKINGLNNKPIKKLDLYNINTLNSLIELTDLSNWGTFDTSKLYNTYFYMIDSDNVLLNNSSSQYTNKAYYDGPFCLQVSNKSYYCSTENRFLNFIASNNIRVWVDSDNDNVKDSGEIKINFTLDYLKDNITLIKQVGPDYSDNNGNVGFNIENINDLKGISDLSSLKYLNMNLLNVGSIRNVNLDLSIFPESIEEIRISTFLNNISILNGSSLSNLSMIQIFKPNVLTDSSFVDFSNFTNNSLLKLSTIGKIEDSVDCGTNMSLTDLNIQNLNLDNCSSLIYLNTKYLSQVLGDKSKITVLKTVITNSADETALGYFTGIESLTAYFITDFGNLSDSISKLVNLKSLNLGANVLTSTFDLSGFDPLSNITDTINIINYNGSITGGLCLTNTILNAVEDSSKASYESEFCMSSYIDQNALLCSLSNEDIVKNNPGITKLVEINANLLNKNPNIPQDDIVYLWADVNNDGIKDNNEIIYPKSNNDIYEIANNKEYIKEIIMPEDLSLDASIFSLINEADLANFADYENLNKLNVVLDKSLSTIDFSKYEENNIGELSIIYTGNITNKVDFSYFNKTKIINFGYGQRADNYKAQVLQQPLVYNLPMLEEFTFLNGNSNYALNPDLSTNNNLRIINLTFGSNETNVLKILKGLEKLEKIDLTFNGYNTVIDLGDLNTNQHIYYLNITEKNALCHIPNNLSDYASCDNSVYTEPFILTGNMFKQDTLETFKSVGIIDFSGLYGQTGLGDNLHLNYHNLYSVKQEGINEGIDSNVLNYIRPLPDSSPFCQSDALLELKSNNLSYYEAVCSASYSYLITSTDSAISQKDTNEFETSLANGSSGTYCIDSGVDLEDYYNVAGSSDLLTDLSPYINIDTTDGQANISIDSFSFSSDKTDLCIGITKTSNSGENLLINFKNLKTVNPKFLHFSDTAIIENLYTDLEGSHNSESTSVKIPVDQTVEVSLYSDSNNLNPIDIYAYTKADKISYNVISGDNTCIEPLIGSDGKIQVFGKNAIKFKLKCSTVAQIELKLSNIDSNDDISGNKYISSFFISDLAAPVSLIGPNKLSVSNGSVIGNYEISDSSYSLTDSDITFVYYDTGLTTNASVDSVDKYKFSVSFNLNVGEPRYIVLKVPNKDIPGIYITKVIEIDPEISTGDTVYVNEYSGSSFLMVATTNEEDSDLVKELRENNVKVYDMDSIHKTIDSLREQYKDSINFKKSSSRIDIFKKIKEENLVEELKEKEISDNIVISNDMNNIRDNDNH